METMNNSRVMYERCCPFHCYAFYTCECLLPDCFSGFLWSLEMSYALGHLVMMIYAFYTCECLLPDCFSGFLWSLEMSYALGHLVMMIFGSKTCFVQVLDCHNSPRRAITRHGKQNGRLECYSQWRANQLAMASEVLLAMASCPTRNGE
jgi:hypothetical protein